ncbi:glyoxalase/bleomycin resistance/extradiol dioxygenase family protein [Dysgonomonas sp. 521]|uniref:VOC family protein n=1 Tax=Dysgonomonas sp. 521 TaxID=2302932 RepID=UPI0013D5755F|nr:VOC family protein [Dysgonomonas sp. 521]NDV93308.1 glyoxalase/bleomycin resistance/extradiol dioxygenase family protein [Dysgonomonas sp. 521]
MKIEHLAIWADDIELLRQFYTKYFHAVSGEKYVNSKRNYSSYFLSFGEGGCRIELMHIPNLHEPASRTLMKGLTHFAVSIGSKEAVDALTERLRTDGYRVVGEPRTSGDGYYESVILDPEGNTVEIVA